MTFFLFACTEEMGILNNLFIFPNAYSFKSNNKKLETLFEQNLEALSSDSKVKHREA